VEATELAKTLQTTRFGNSDSILPHPQTATDTILEDVQGLLFKFWAKNQEGTKG